MGVSCCKRQTKTANQWVKIYEILPRETPPPKDKLLLWDWPQKNDCSGTDTSLTSTCCSCEHPTVGLWKDRPEYYCLSCWTKQHWSRSQGSCPNHGNHGFVAPIRGPACQIGGQKRVNCCFVVPATPNNPTQNIDPPTSGTGYIKDLKCKIGPDCIPSNKEVNFYALALPKGQVKLTLGVAWSNLPSRRKE